MDRRDSGSQTWAIEVQGLTKSFGSHLALRGVDLKVKQGESIAIFGPNGAGKTTLIKLLATILNPSSGRILIDGLNLKNHAEEVRRRLGVVTHQTFLYGHLTASENLEFYSRLYDVPGYKAQIQEVVATVGMTSRLHERVNTLSRGMQQRLSIARALLHKPKIILLDEPETGLDQQAIAMLWEALLAEGKEKCTLVHTSHNLESGLERCDRFLILAEGKIVYQGSRQALDLVALRQAYQQYTRTSL